MPPIKQLLTNPAKPPEASVPMPTQAPPVVAGKKIIFPSIIVNKQIIDEEDLKLTYADAIKILKWEDEVQYQARLKAENPEIKKVASYGEEFLLKDYYGNKVRCWRNANNRPFEETHCRKLAQQILMRQWELNCETIIVGQCGTLLSGQHRLIALVLAVQMWRSKEQGEYWSRYWTEEPYIRTLVVYGASEDPKVIQTLDNVKPRTLTDVFYTSPLFQSLNTKGRKEASRMMDYAVDLLWKRTCFTAGGGQTTYQTHSSSVEFYERHPKLLDCVTVMFKHNENRRLSALGLSPGNCAALLYMMGSSSTDPDVSYLEERNESALSWDNYEKACEFWKQVVEDADKPDKPVTKALTGLRDVDTSLGGRLSEKLAIIIKAWLVYVNDGEWKDIEPQDLELEYDQYQDGKWYLAEWPVCGGIDFGGDKPDDGDKKKTLPDPTPEEIEAEKKKIREENARKAQDVVKGKAKPSISKVPTPPAAAAAPVTDDKLVVNKPISLRNLKGK